MIVFKAIAGVIKAMNGMLFELLKMNALLIANVIILKIALGSNNDKGNR
jgi:hypothetical protein